MTAPGRVDLILRGGHVWTLDTARIDATAVAVRGELVAAVGSDAEIERLADPRTEVVDLAGRLVLPGFIDAHTHVGNAARWTFQLGVSYAGDAAELLGQVAQAARRLPRGVWITGGDVGGSAAWRGAGAHDAPPAPMAIDRYALDRAAPDRPVLLRRADGAHVASSVALQRARIGDDTPDAPGGGKERDADGRLTGVLHGRDGEAVARLLPPVTRELDLVGARIVLQDLAAAGITSIHDIARLDEASQRQLLHTDVERSATDLEIFRELQRRDELSLRVYAILSLPLWREVVAAGIRPRSDEGRIRYGALKSFVDGYLMDEPYVGGSYAGDFTFRFVDEATMAANIVGADAAGFDAAIHTVGDKAHRLLLDWYEAAIRANPPRDRRFRVIHAWYPARREVERIGRLGLIVDLTPQHLVIDVGSVERKLGRERAATAHAWRSLARAGARLDMGSDLPGRYGDHSWTPYAPLQNIALAVGREWHAEEALTVEAAVAAYTTGPAYASYEEDRKGTITAGKLADLVVLSQDIRSCAAADIAATRVDLTLLGGRVVHRAD